MSQTPSTPGFSTQRAWSCVHTAGGPSLASGQPAVMSMIATESSDCVTRDPRLRALKT
jgi:hypothetical protein